MKKLLSVLLIVSTLFLSLGFQTCFAGYNEDILRSAIVQTEDNIAKIQQDEKIKNLERHIENLENRLNDANDLNEKYEEKIKKLKNKLKNADDLNEKYKALKMQLKEEKLEKKISIWGIAKSKFRKNVGNKLSKILGYTLLIISILGLSIISQCVNIK